MPGVEKGTEQGSVDCLRLRPVGYPLQGERGCERITDAGMSQEVSPS